VPQGRYRFVSTLFLGPDQPPAAQGNSRDFAAVMAQTGPGATF
jgi:hypothetical protein